MLTIFSLPCALQALLATLFTWLVTALGAAVVLLTRGASRRMLDAMLAFGAGVMLASSFWSLLAPGAALAVELGQPAWLILAGGFLLGALLPEACDRFLPQSAAADGHQSTRLMILAITLHNIPEGLAVGVAFGACAASQVAPLTAAWMLAFGVAMQNFPEGAAVSLPLRREGMSRKKALFYGQLSAVVEPVAGLCGALLAARTQLLLPFALAFAAGAMVAVAATDLIPESRKNLSRFAASLATSAGFIVMMCLDVALG